MNLHDPTEWLMAQTGPAAVRARRRLGLRAEGDLEAAAATARDLAPEQRPDGSFAGSPMRTAGVLCLLADLGVDEPEALRADAAGYLFGVLAAQPGYERAKRIGPGELSDPWDLCGFFGPYEDRALPDVMARGAEEMNHYREFEPLLGPGSPVRSVRRSTRDRAGPSSCYSWGLIPLCYAVEALCRAGRAEDPRLTPAVNALLGAQWPGGGWCRNPPGGSPCTLYGLRAVGAHPVLRRSEHAERALESMQSWQRDSGDWRLVRGQMRFAAVDALSAFRFPAARAILRKTLDALQPRQRRNGSFGGPHPVERAAAVLRALRALDEG
jgi:hypothetical protein